MDNGNKKIQVFDTTLRDGTQAEKISFSADDKLHIAQRLDQMGFDYIEGGWPGSNPKDMKFFEKAKDMDFKNSKIVAFGSTRHAKNNVEDDPNIQALLDAETPAVSLFGKSWTLHVDKALKVSKSENLEMISDSIRYLKENNKEVIYDAEHFFDGYLSDPDYALETLQVAEEAGADMIVLCDTNGGTLPATLREIIDEVMIRIQTPIGIHAHNDSGVAVANTIDAVQAGAVHIQGTINGYGERCGNANLCSIIPNLQLKAGYKCLDDDKIKKMTSLSHYVSEVANLMHPNSMPFTGKSAFAHKGGIHVSAVMREESSYEHIKPEEVGNSRRVLVSDLSGKSNIRFKAQELGIDLSKPKHKKNLKEIVDQLKILEHEGYQYEAAEASLELLINKINGEYKSHFELIGFRIFIEKDQSGEIRSEASIRVIVDGVEEHTAAEGNGPVNALDNALRKALIEFYPEVSKLKLEDYKVRVLNGQGGTGARVRVLIETGTEESDQTWGTVGASRNIIQASWQALTESVSYYLMKSRDLNKTQE
ncbi:MAG: citramalate synthase [Candidatus Marinimicrobia bacterium]|nr:citramalate synthase [Candidatus Neomarinimicrobiota bacterium]